MEDSNYFLNGLINNDERIVREIYKSSYRQVLSFISNNKGQRTDADDIFQKALMQIMVRAKTRPFSIKSSFQAFLFVSCKNLWRRELNKKKKEVTNDYVFEHVTEERDLALSILEQERWEFFQNKLKLISDNCKQILECFFNKIPNKDIAEKLGYNSENVVRQRVFKCKNKLIELIKSDNKYSHLKSI
ncbi:RNA polymerase sigma factor [Psychroserpens sp. SPM9]|uniref:RNA polymerase sigma factor n=1 Tax=Psychroserpens sp. SPM9 TaxID=2975598 RepID=UPI0021A27175|nr:sigma-70 family RNA polymerase sigma factor [Psychroserpens sp. SPM9]MDG5492525.1 sigma-70 family RNA polymerase sigma factor [Psychroserpens sp. SPM9]